MGKKKTTAEESPNKTELVAAIAEEIAVATSENSSQVSVTITKHGFATLPSYQTSGSAGVDAHANLTMSIWIKPGETKLIPTGLKVIVPEGYCLKVYPRSGLALKKGISLINSVGIIDSDYRDEIGIALVNHGDQNVEIKRGERVAQLLLEKVETISWNEVSADEFQTIVESEESNERKGGFGSTGK